MAPSDRIEAPAARAAIKLDDQQRRDAGIEIASVGAASIIEVVPVYGHIAAVADRVRHVAARYPGIARRVMKNIGDSVAAGETLLIVESNDSLQPYRIKAPIAGLVVERHVNDGEALGSDTLFVIADLSQVWAQLEVFPRDAVGLQIGQRVDIHADRTQAPVQAQLDYIAPSSDPQRRSIPLRATLDNASGRWRPGQFISADLEIAAHDVALAVSQAAIQDLDGQASVFVETAAGFVPRALRTGKRDRRHVEVIDGLQAGERVAVGNSFLLKSEWLAEAED
ncbi:efflux RND transporter periplasmic adaptor subunit [Solimonas marina]|uniref:efflux RND transporter periplasmic adaptor subunit n=1 Tax=Solimonas marina TaxID=2714601 RepID=UPI00344C5863